jgi:hypothetical protein
MSEKILRVEVVVNEKNKEAVWNLLNFSMDNNCFFIFEVDEKKSTQVKEKPVPTQSDFSKEEKPVLTRSEISKLTQDAMELRKKELRPFTGPVFGWDKKGGKLKPNWKEQKVIDFMRFMYHQEKWSGSRIAKQLDKSGGRGKKGGKWTSASVMRNIRNDFHKKRDAFEKPKSWAKNKFPEMTWGKNPSVKKS